MCACWHTQFPALKLSQLNEAVWQKEKIDIVTASLSVKGAHRGAESFTYELNTSLVSVHNGRAIYVNTYLGQPPTIHGRERDRKREKKNKKWNNCFAFGGPLIPRGLISALEGELRHLSSWDHHRTGNSGTRIHSLRHDRCLQVQRCYTNTLNINLSTNTTNL